MWVKRNRERNQSVGRGGGLSLSPSAANRRASTTSAPLTYVIMAVGTYLRTARAGKNNDGCSYQWYVSQIGSRIWSGRLA